jgi:hypothetical protein
VVTCVRWAQINPANAAIVQAGVVGSSGQYRFFGDLATNHCSDMTLGYSKSSSSSYPSIWVAGRQGTDPLNTIQGETLMKAGEKTYSSFDPPPYRWGDYTGFTSDPNGRDFWYLGQYSKNVSHPAANWGTFVGCYVPSSCIPPNAAANGTAEVKMVDSPPTLPEGFDQFSFLPAIGYDPYVPQPCGFSN